MKVAAVVTGLLERFAIKMYRLDDSDSDDDDYDGFSFGDDYDQVNSAIIFIIRISHDQLKFFRREIAFVEINQRFTSNQNPKMTLN